MAGRRALVPVVLASCAAWAAAFRQSVEPKAGVVGALAVNGSRAGEHSRHLTRLEEHRAQCALITECFCTKGTPCGWCETFGEARVSANDGPADAQHCPKWITSPENCPVLYCSTEGAKAELAWCLTCGWFPFCCFSAWLGIYFWRQWLRAQHILQVEAVEVSAKSVSFATGHGVGGKNFERARSFVLESHEDGLSHVERQAVDFFGTRRTFEAFKKGLDCPESERLPKGAKRPFELNLTDLSTLPGENHEKSRIAPHRIAMTVKIGLQWRTALGATLPFSFGLMLMSSLFLLFLRNCARHLNHEEYATVALLTRELGAVVGSLQTAVSMLLSFYALNRIGWFWGVMSACFTVQGRSHDLGMICGAGAKRSTEDDLKARWTLYRYVMLSFFFGLQPYTPKLRFIGYGPLVKCGLLEPAEAEILPGAHRGPGTLVESWIALWIEQHMTAEARQQAFHALRELRANLASIGDKIDQRAPVSFESLLYVTVYALCLIMPFGPSHIDYENRMQVMSRPHCAGVLGITVVCTFYLALLHMLRHLQAPFDEIGAPNDALNPIALMNSTERKLRDYLSTRPPPAVWIGAADQPPSPKRGGDLAMKISRSKTYDS